KSDLEEQMARSSRAQSLIARRDAFRDERDRHQRDFEQAQIELERRASSAWRAMLSPAVERLIQHVDTELGVLSERRRQAEAALLAADQLRHARETGTCPICGQAINADLITDLAAGNGD